MLIRKFRPTILCLFLVIINAKLAYAADEQIVSIGIDAIAAYSPSQYLDLIEGEWPAARAANFSDGDTEQLKSKLRNGIGISRLAIAHNDEDIVTMASMAIKKLLEENSVDLDDVGYMALATETGIDHSKSGGSFILGVLQNFYKKKFPHISTPETKFACIGSTYALESVLALMKAKMIRKRYAILVTSDIAKYALKSPAEFTQGAGAIALLISANPRLIEIDDLPFGIHNEDQNDFYKPMDLEHPVVDGIKSVKLYVDMTYRALLDYAPSMGQFLQSVDKILYHLPFPKISEKAAVKIFLSMQRPSDGLLEQEIDDCEMRAIRKSEEFRSFFDEKTQDSLALPSEIGNIYTGSLFLGLVSLLEQTKIKGESLKGKRVVFCAYGSGACSKAFAGKFVNDLSNFPNYRMLTDDMAQRSLMSLAEYESIHRSRREVIIQARVSGESQHFTYWYDESVGRFRLGIP